MLRVIVDYSLYKYKKDLVVVWDDSTTCDSVVEFSHDEVFLLSRFVKIAGVFVDKSIIPAVVYVDSWGERNYLVCGRKPNGFSTVKGRIVISDFSDPAFHTLFSGRVKLMFGSDIQAIVSDRDRLIFLVIPDSVKFTHIRLGSIACKLGYNFLAQAPEDFTLIVDDNIVSMDSVEYSDTMVCFDASTCHNRDVLNFIYRNELYSVSGFAYKLPDTELSNIFIESFLTSYERGELPKVPKQFLSKYHDLCRPLSEFGRLSFDVCANFLPMLFLFYAKMNHWLVREPSDILAPASFALISPVDGERYISPDFILRNCNLAYTLEPEVLAKKWAPDWVKLSQLQHTYYEAYDLLVYTYLTEDKDLIADFNKVYLQALSINGYRVDIYDDKFAKLEAIVAYVT